MSNAKEKRFINDIADLIDTVSLGALYGEEFSGRTDY